MQERLKSIILKSSQKAWQLDFPEMSVPSHTDNDGQLHSSRHRIPISTTNIASIHGNQHQNKNKHNTSSHAPDQDNDDDFMPPTKQHVRARTSGSLGQSLCNKLPSVRCTPSIIIKVIEQLNMPQRQKICEIGFGGLLNFCAAGLDCTDLLVYLMGKLNPESMILEVGNEGGLSINESCVKKILGLPDGDKDLPGSTEVQYALALADFKKSVHVERNNDIKCNYLFDMLRKIRIDNSICISCRFLSGIQCP